jgi:hypothetical protein
MIKIIKKKITCKKCKKVFYCDNICVSEKTDCLCKKCFLAINSGTGMACESRCKQLNKPMTFIFR